MNVRSLVVFACLAPVFLGVGCSSECGEPQKLNGRYAVWSNALQHDPEAVPGDYPSYEMFYNGWSEWNLQYEAGSGKIQAIVNGQEFSAEYAEASDNCNRVTLSMKGTYNALFDYKYDDVADAPDQGCIDARTSVESIFEWTGDLVYTGDQLAGTWTYAASWSNPVTSAADPARPLCEELAGAEGAGSVTARGEFVGSISDGETGFPE